jgi:hypothetical protein
MSLTVHGVQSQPSISRTTTAEVNVFMVGPERKGGNPRMLEVAGIVHKVALRQGDKVITQEVYKPVYSILTSVEHTKAGTIFKQIILNYDEDGLISSISKRVFLLMNDEAERVAEEPPEMPPVSEEFSTEESDKTDRAYQQQEHRTSSESARPQERARPHQQQQQYRPSSGYKYTYNPSSNTTQARPAEQEDPNIVKGRDYLGDRLGTKITKDSNDYELLGLSPNASNDEVRAAYKKHVRALHPDKASSEDRLAAQEAFKMFSAAYQRLYKEPEFRPEAEPRTETRAPDPAPKAEKEPDLDEAVPVSTPSSKEESQILAIEPPPQEEVRVEDKLVEREKIQVDLPPVSVPDDSGPAPAA